jgi:hypothetical protein
VNIMPRRDGTGPMNAGAATRRGLGFCRGFNTAEDKSNFGRGPGYGRRCRQNFGKYCLINQTSSETQKDILQERKNILRERIEFIDKELEKM